jgi:mRNA interferase RelE/StbE
MPRYRVEFKPAAERDLRSLPREIQERVRTEATSLAENPLPPGARKLEGREDVWRIRVGHYRVLYQIHSQELLVLIVRVGHRRDIYR